MKLCVATLVLSLAAPAAAFANGATSCAAGPTASTRGSLAAGGMTVYFGNLNLETDVGMETPPGGQDYTPVGLCTGTLNLATGFNLCERCQGDCDDDTECAPGLICFQRSADEPVPGCYGLAVTDRDYCYDPNYMGPVPAPTMGAFVPAPAPTFPAPTFPAPTFPAPTLPAMGNLDVIGDCDGDDNDFCGKCVGDCDDDGDCEDGLFCFQRDDDEDVPGCNGDMGDDPGVDYCVPEFYRGNRKLRATNQKTQKQEKQPEIRKLQGGTLEFQTTREYTISLDGQGQTFQGFLIRASGAQGQDLSDVLDTDVFETQILPSDGQRDAIPGVAPASCAVGVSGATHVNTFAKQRAQALIRIPSSAAGMIRLEVTAMINENLSYLTEYILIAKDAADMTIPPQVPAFPTAPTAAAPVAAPGTATDSPTAADTEELPDGAVRFPALGIDGEMEFGEIGQCTGPGGVCMQCQGDCDNDAECGNGLVCYQRRANEEVPFCYGVALIDRDYCSLPQGSTSPAATVTGSAGIMAAATAVAIGIAVMFA